MDDNEQASISPGHPEPTESVEPTQLSKRIANFPPKELDPIDLRGKRICVFGLPGSGKTIFTKMVALHYKTIIFDIHGEYRPDVYERWVPENKQYGAPLLDEFDQAMNQIVFNPVNNFEMLIVDEAHQYFPNGRLLPPAMMKLNAFNRHMNLAFCLTSHRPTQLKTDLVELAHYCIFFKLSGRNDLRFMKDLYPGLDEEVFSLGPHEFVLYESGKGFHRCAPIQVA